MPLFSPGRRVMKMDAVVLCQCVLVVLGVFSVGAAKVSLLVKEGESVTLNTSVKTNEQQTIRWYFNNIRIAQINGDPSTTCEDVQCNDVTEKFRDRLKLDHQNGSLTIMNTRTTDSGEYLLEITINTGGDIEIIFNVTVLSVFAERDEMKGTSVQEAESDSGLSPAAVAGICVGVFLLLMAAVAGVIYYRRNYQAGQNDAEDSDGSCNQQRSSNSSRDRHYVK
ncbi:uncharacterized protein [Garra rufa]|uniref:uncharacterized protein n=1 Tax=Garra rufa TaxID=137080 RepID=UPI003CCE6EFC